MTPTIVKIEREEIGVTVFLNLNEMIELRVGDWDDKFRIVLTMTDGTEYPLDVNEMELVLNTLYGTRADLLIKSIKRA